MSFKRNSMFWYWMIALVLIVVCLLAWVAPALAQDVLPIPTINPDDDPLTILTKILMILVSTCLIPAAVQHFRAKGHDIEAKHQRTLQTAALNAAALIFDNTLTLEQKRVKAITYVLENAPDALTYFKLIDRPEAIWEKIEAARNKLSAPLLASTELAVGTIQEGPDLSKMVATAVDSALRRGTNSGKTIPDPRTAR